MRTIRVLAAVFALLTVPQIGSAQEGRHFKDSWFWGAKVGSMKFKTLESKGYAQLIGAEWLITRSRGALYLALDETFFGKENFSAVPNPYDADDGLASVVLRDLRRATVAAMVFPTMKRGYLRPYAGAGFVLLDFNAAHPEVGYADPAESQYVLEEIENSKSGASALGIVGLQAQFRRLSAFGQGSFMPASGSGFLLNDSYTMILEVGLRYNIGTSIDRPF